jgi:antitoxin (DNA-binding transcriptional repressor) of toxin-antitoxin stability system
MTSMTIHEAQTRLLELVSKLRPGEEVALTQYDRVVAKLVGEAPKSLALRQPGSAVGVLTVVAEDDEHLNDFAPYMS